MSVSKWIWKSLDLYARTYQRLDKVTFYWDRKKLRFRMNTNWRSQLFFAFKVFFILGGSCLVTSMLAIYSLVVPHTKHNKEFLYPLEMVFPTFLYWGPVGETECTSFMICFLGKGLAQTLNSFVEIALKSKGKPSRGSQIAGISTYFCLLSFFMYPIILPPFVVYMKLDPYIYCIHWFFYYITVPFKSLFLQFTLILSIPVRWILMVVVFIEVSRPFPLAMAIAMLVIVCLRDTLKKLKLGDPTKVISSVNSLHVILSPGMPCIDFFVTFLLILGVIGTVVLNVVIIKLNPTLPTYFRFIAPLLQVFYQLFLFNTLPAAIAINDTCIESLREAKKELKSPYLRRKLVATRPVALRVALFGYNFFNVDKGLMSSYFKAVLDNTITVLLAIPDTDFKTWFLNLAGLRVQSA